MRNVSGREPEDVDRASDREVRLVAGVDARAFEGTRAGRLVEAEQPREVDVSRGGERHDVRHHAARGEHGPRALAEPDQRAQPRRDLLLDERADGSRDPDVDALVHPLREELARDRHRERRGREVAVRPRVLRVEDVGCDALAELPEHVRGVRGLLRSGRWLAGRPEERSAHLGVRQGPERPLHRVLVQVSERLVPESSSEPFERGT